MRRRGSNWAIVAETWMLLKIFLDIGIWNKAATTML